MLIAGIIYWPRFSCLFALAEMFSVRLWRKCYWSVSGSEIGTDAVGSWKCSFRHFYWLNIQLPSGILLTCVSMFLTLWS